MRTLRTTTAVVVLACLLAAVPARGQDFLSSTVTGAQLRASYFQATYGPQPGQSWPAMQGHLVHVYRASIDDGTITLGATLAANSAPRAALGPSSMQTLRITHVAGTVAADTHIGTPSQALSVEAALVWDKAPSIFTYPLVLAYDVEVSGLSAACGNSVCNVKQTILVLPKRAAIAIGGVERTIPMLLSRQTAHVDLASAGISPFAEWESISLDGVALTKVPFMAGYAIPPALHWYRHPVRSGDATQSGDPLPPTGVDIPGTDTSIEKFLVCGAAGCGTHQARIGLGQDAIATGLHTLKLRTRPWAGGTYGFYQTEADVGAAIGDDTAELTTQFLVYGPQITVSPTEAGPGQPVTVAGSGFAPDSQVRFLVRISATSQQAALGIAATDVTGSFATELTLPPVDDAFFSDVIESGPRTGYIQVDVDDAQFLADYFSGGAQSVTEAMTFLPVATVTTTTSVGTTTTLPGGGEPGDVGLDEVPACAASPVPAKAVQKFDQADTNLDIVEQMILEAAKRKAIKKVIGKADAALAAVRRLVNRSRKKGIIPDVCAAAAFDLIDDLRERAREARKNI